MQRGRAQAANRHGQFERTGPALANCAENVGCVMEGRGFDGQTGGVEFGLGVRMGAAQAPTW